MNDPAPDILFRRARLADVSSIAVLVNSAYRGDASRAGWTTEADLLGGQRTDEQEIAQLVAREDSVLLLCLRAGELMGSVHVERVDDATAYLGMLVIKPILQAQGLGRRLMEEAERFAHGEWGTRRIEMQVITQRHELIAWYERCGYRRSGEIRPFPYGDARFGLPKIAGLEFEVLVKQLV